jgi:hypothetical protein
MLEKRLRGTIETRRQALRDLPPGPRAAIKRLLVDLRFSRRFRLSALDDFTQYKA